MPPRAEPAATDRRADGRFLLALAAYFAAFAVVRWLISDAVELDEAEQVLLTQWWQWGYSAQPPLYTWLQGGVNALAGVGIPALAVLREGLLFLAYLFVYLSARRLLAQPAAVSATLALMLLPQVVWENQREHTHSLLVLCLAAATLFLALRLFERRHLAGYLAVGVAAGLGLLAKYNFVLFAGALVLAMFALPAGRRVLFDVRSLAAIAVAAVIVLPHLLWLSGQDAVAGAVADKMGAGEATAAGPLRSLGQVALTTLTFLTPFWLVFALAFPRAVVRVFRGPGIDAAQVRLLGWYLAIVLAALVFTAWAVGADQIKDRWLQPLLFVVPIWLFAHTVADPREARRQRVFAGIAWGVGLTVLAVTALRIPLAPVTGVYSRLHQPIAEVAAQLADRLADAGIDDGLIVADHYHLAGALRLHLPQRRLYGPRADFLLPAPATLAAGGPLVLVWDAARSPDLPPYLATVAADAGLATAGAPAFELTAPYRFGPDRIYRLGVVIPGHAAP